MDELKKHEEKISSLLEVAATTGKAAESTFSPAYSRSFRFFLTDNFLNLLTSSGMEVLSVFSRHLR